MLLLLLDDAAYVLHVPAGHGHAAEAALPVERDVSAPGVAVDPPRAVDHDASGVGVAVRTLQAFKVVTRLVAVAVTAGHLEPAHGRAVAPGDVAEHRRLGGAALPGAVHRVSPVDDLPFGEGPDEDPGTPARDAIVHEQAVVRIHALASRIFEGLFGARLDTLVPASVEPAEEEGTDASPCGQQDQDGKQDEGDSSFHGFHRYWSSPIICPFPEKVTIPRGDRSSGGSSDGDRMGTPLRPRVGDEQASARWPCRWT